MKRFYHQFKRYLIFAFIGYILIPLLLIPLQLTIAKTQAPLPQAFLILGGDHTREKFTAELAAWYPSLEVWVSSPANPKETQEIFKTTGIANTRLHIDSHAVDTVTNFTTLVSNFKQRHFRHIYLITSDYHMPRAKAIATLVLGSQGITFTPVSAPSNQPPESKLRVIRDVLRALLWIFTGYTGANFKVAEQSYHT